MLPINIGEGIAFGAACFAGAQVAIVALKQKSATNGNGVAKVFCDERHKGIERELTGINEKLIRMDDNQMKILEAVMKK